jgi:RHS repeat-associated protein
MRTRHWMDLLLLAVAVTAPPLHASGPGPAVVSDAERMSWSTGVNYSYDGSGNVAGIGTQKYYYDAAGRLVYSTNPEGGATGYSYDAFGNRKSCTPPAGGSCQAGLTVNSSTNRLSAPVVYDASGRVTAFQGHTIAYDAVDMPHRDTFGGTTEYIYTADDERIAVVTPNGQWEWSVRGPSGKVVREFTSTGSTNFQWRKDYIWRDQLLLATRQREPNGTVTTYHYHLDHLGTPRRITDDADRIVGKSDYDPFGPRLSGGTNPPSPNRLQFTGHERDTGPLGEQTDTLDYMHARYYSPYAGRFLSVDPVLNFDSVVPRPQRWNRYAYGLNNPLIRIDPDGRKDKMILLSSLGYGDTVPSDAQLSAAAQDAGKTAEVVRRATKGEIIGTLGQVDQSGTDVVIFAAHTKNGPPGNHSEIATWQIIDWGSLTADEVVAALGDGRPEVIVLYGCSTAGMAKQIAAATGVPTLGIYDDFNQMYGYSDFVDVVSDALEGQIGSLSDGTSYQVFQPPPREEEQ